MQDQLPQFSISHLEFYVQDLPVMERFYTDCLGFLVTDRGDGPNGMIFLSRSPHEHHQLVLNPVSGRKPVDSPLDHLSLRVSSLEDLRFFYLRLKERGDVDADAACHGTAWSIYFRDPEGNRIEIFTDTPWYVNQPCKFKIDLSQSADDLYASTLDHIKDMPGFAAAGDWHQQHRNRFTD